jgi:hypothetical protein
MFHSQENQPKEEAQAHSQSGTVIAEQGILLHQTKNTNRVQSEKQEISLVY